MNDKFSRLSSGGLQRGAPDFSRKPFVALLLTWVALVLPLSADQFGLFTYIDQGSTIQITGYPKDAAGEVVVPAQIAGKPVTSIKSYAFETCVAITGVTLPDSITSIGSGAFYSCGGLTNVVLPSGLTSIPSSLFYGCGELTGVNLPPNLTSIGGSAFYGCIKAAIASVPASVTSIGSLAFYQCGLTGVTVSANLVTIGTGAFHECPDLDAITVDASNPNYSSVDGVLLDKDQTRVIQCPGGFHGNFTIPPSVTTIDPSAFKQCGELTAVTIPPGVTSIGTGAFSQCSGLSSISLPSGLTGLSQGIFAGCTSLTSVSIPSTVTSIGSYAFWYCTSLAGVTIPAGVTSIDQYSFAYSGLTHVVLPTGITDVPSEAFSHCASLASVTIPPSVTSISSRAFENCTALASVTIPQGVTTIWSDSFINCSALTGFSIPASVANIQDKFYGCGSLTSISVDPANPNYSGEGGVLFNKAKTQLLRCPEGFAGGYILPSSVTNIGSSSFKGCTGLTGVTIPNSVTEIGRDAFSGSGLVSVFVPASVLEIKASFTKCPSLISITVDPANANHSSEDGVLYNKTKSTLLTCPGSFSGNFSILPGVTFIGEDAFKSCLGLTGVQIPSSVATIGVSAFANCTGLTQVSIPVGVTEVWGGAFSSCTGLTRVTLPAGLIKIRSEAFSYCPGLTSVTIPAGVTTIDDHAFMDCGNLKSAIFLGNAPYMGLATTGFGVSNVFNLALPHDFPPPGFKVYYFGGSSGFTSPTWVGYPTVNMGAASVAKAWLVSHGFAHDANLRADTDGDGVDLLTAYALKLDPRKNLAGSLPKPVMDGGTLKLTFYAGNGDVGYGVQSSDDLVNWSTDGISLSPPDAEGMRTATASAGGSRRYVRLALSR